MSCLAEAAAAVAAAAALRAVLPACVGVPVASASLAPMSCCDTPGSWYTVGTLTSAPCTVTSAPPGSDISRAAKRAPRRSPGRPLVAQRREGGPPRPVMPLHVGVPPAYQPLPLPLPLR